jgi:hypothetical protein
MKRIHLAILLILAAYIGMSATSSHQTKPADPGFKNLQILPKDISKEKLDSIMRSFCISLGVRCSFCHARTADTTQFHLDFASDAKPDKKAARGMMLMTEHIDTTFFNYYHSTHPDTIHTIICYTCHRGAYNPGFLSNQLDSLTKVLEHK